MGSFFSHESDKAENNSDTKTPLSIDFKENLHRLKEEFAYPVNQDFIIREVFIQSTHRSAVLLFMSGMINNDTIEQHIITPLLEETKNKIHNTHALQNLITAKTGQRITSVEDSIDHILMGNTLLLMEGYEYGISIETTGFEHRSVEKPISENVLKGPQEAFVESAAINRSLIRKQIRDKNLVTESITVGKKAKSAVFLMYINNIVEPRLLEQVKQRISNIEADIIQNISILEQYVEERSYSIIPSTLYTERPDRAAAFLHEGHIVLLMDSSPDCLVVPITFWSLFHTAEDTYQRWPYGIFIRIVRLIAFFIALLTPSLFIAITTYHVEMIPTDLVLAIAATRERVPMPVLVEVLLMEIAFELLRESGIRIPTPIGPTIGIVGALILGQAAVQANLVSPILVIIVAVTGLSSFAISNNSLNYMVRILKFGLLLLGATMGVTGVTAGVMVLLAYLVSSKSFDVPFLSPMAPHFPSSKDMILRPPIWKQWIRPSYTNPQDTERRKVPKRR